MGTEGEVGKARQRWGLRKKGGENVGDMERKESGKSEEARQRGKSRKGGTRKE